MSNYVLFTDSCSNLNDVQCRDLDVNVVALNFIIDGESHTSYVKGQDCDLKFFYDTLRDGKRITTTSVNEDQYTEAWTPYLEQGKDILYLAFSSGLSASYEHGQITADELAKKFPDRKIVVIDTLAASYGQGLLVYYAAKMRLDGKPLEDVAQWVEDNKLHLAHWFTVESLKYLYRGGRVSRLSYWLGSIAQIKPVMHTDNNGHLTPVSKVLGRKKSIAALADRVANSIVDPENQVIFIVHGDCESDAQLLIDKLKAKITVKDYVVSILDPVIGCHSGPGTLAVFCLATER